MDPKDFDLEEGPLSDLSNCQTTQDESKFFAIFTLAIRHES